MPKQLPSLFLQNLQVQSLGQHDRKLCFELLECLLERYPNTVAPMGDELIYGICEAVDSEKDPQCLMLTFHIVEVLVQLFPDTSGPFASFAGDLFEILSCYFPIHFTHPRGEDLGIKRDDLSWALMGIQQAYKPGIGKQKLEASLGWFMCHPKTCVLVEPLDEKSLNNVADGWQMPITTHFQSANKLVFSKGGQYPMWPSTK